MYKTKYVYSVNTNVKYIPKPAIIILASGIDSGHC